MHYSTIHSPFMQAFTTFIRHSFIHSSLSHSFMHSPFIHSLTTHSFMHSPFIHSLATHSPFIHSPLIRHSFTHHSFTINSPFAHSYTPLITSSDVSLFCGLPVRSAQLPGACGRGGEDGTTSAGLWTGYGTAPVSAPIADRQHQHRRPAPATASARRPRRRPD